MELFTGNPNVMKEDIINLMNALHHSRSQSDSLHIYSMLQTLSYFYKYLDEDGYDYFVRDICNFKSFISKQNVIHNAKVKKVIKNYIDNKRFHQEFVDYLMDDKEIKYPNDLVSIYGDYSLSDNEMYIIFSDFLNKYNTGSVNLLNSLIDEKRIYKVNFYGDTLGVTVSNFYLGNYNMFIPDEEDVNSMLVLAHEFGHVVDGNNLYYSLSKKIAYDYHSKSLFTETISSLYEKDFADFLIKEKVYPNAVRDYLLNYYHTMYTSFDCAQLTACLPNNLLMNYKYRGISKEKMIEKLNESNYRLQEEDVPYPTELDITSDIKYGYGKFLAIYFSYLRKNDIGKYSDQLNRFLNIRSDYFRPDFLEYIGTNRETAVKMVEEEINNSVSKVIVKKTS